ncbi:MAG: PAS domain-containing protein [Flavobacteriaceae bacterium]|nr:PAS domain-containing protein [Candidatus Onthonaster equi]
MTNKSKIRSDWDFWLKFPNNAAKETRPQINKSFYFIYNCITNEILYTSDSFKEILGYSKEDYTFVEIINFLHPEDYDYVIASEKKGIEFTRKLTVSELQRFITTYSYRTKTTYGHYIRVQQSYHALEVNDQGSMTRAIVFHELIDYHQPREKDDFKIFDRLTNRYVQLENRFNLTKRENEIFELIMKGNTSLQISEKLHLSKLTVDTHRKNILAKTNTKNFMVLGLQSN